MGQKNGAETVKIQVSVDETTDAVLNQLIPLGLRGKNKSEVAYGIIRDWIWNNQKELEMSGIKIKSPQ